MPATEPSPRAAPVVETERLTLLAHRPIDLDECTAMWGDPAVVRHIGGKPSTREECWSRILRYAGHWALLGFGYWAVRETSTGRFVGEVGFADFRRDLQPSFEGTPEIGWVLAPWAHGKGFATEAAGAAVAWADGQFGPVRSVCLIHPDNAASIGVARKCGYREYARTTYHGEPAVLLERRPDRLAL